MIRSARGVFVSTAWRLRVGCEEARLVGEHDRLDAVTEVELLEDVRDVGLDCRVAGVELLADHALTGTLRPYVPPAQLGAIPGGSTLLALLALTLPTRRVLRRLPITAVGDAD